MAIAMKGGLPEELNPRAVALKQRGDMLFYAGCLVCGTWVLGVIGAAILLYGV